MFSDPSNPPAPTELRVADMSFGPGRAVSARISWSVPADLDVPIHHYKVSWSWTADGHPFASSMTKRRKTVREVKNVTTYSIYFVTLGLQTGIYFKKCCVRKYSTSSPQSQVFSRLQQVFFQDCPVFGSIHLPISSDHLPCPC